jgi:glycosyltransferase involved in cell wall biosynthesis
MKTDAASASDASVESALSLSRGRVTLGVSVVIPCRNGAKYLRECLESALAQDFVGLMEILVADDGSTDGSQEIVESFGSRVRLLRCPEGATHGPAAARNRAIMASTHPLVALLDQDDLWLPGHLSTLASLMAAQPDLGMACDNGHYISSTGKKMGSRIAESLRPALTADSLLLDCFIAPCGVMIRRSAIEQVGLFDEDLLLVDDHDMWLRLLEVFPAAYVAIFGYCYRLHSEQNSLNPLMWRNAEQVLAKARTRHPYSCTLVRKRRAVLAYRHGEIAFRERRFCYAIGLLGKAAFLDPPRALKELGVCTKRLLRRGTVLRAQQGVPR